MSARFEIVHTGPRAFHARFVAENGETVWVTESYTRRQSAREAVELLDDHFYFYARADGPPVIEVDERGAS